MKLEISRTILKRTIRGTWCTYPADVLRFHDETVLLDVITMQGTIVTIVEHGS